MSASHTPEHRDAMAAGAAVRTETTTHADPARRRPAPGRTTGLRGPRSLEIEADATADALLAGATGLAARLTPAEAAPRLATGEHGALARTSGGRPLSPAVRRRLESGFGADLAAVRVHDDAGAHALAAGEGVEAIAVGSHLYFAAGRYRPGTDAGLHLLGHETAHALQQTARRAASGDVAATDIAGSGDAQAADEFLDRFTGLDGLEILAKVTGDHAGTDPTTSPIATLVDSIGRQLPAGVDPATVPYQALVTMVTEGHHMASDPAELSYLYDLMKAGRQWDAAATLLDLDHERQLGTAKHSSELAAWFATTKGLEWVDRIIGTYGPLTSLRGYVYGAFRWFLVRPDVKPYRVPGSRYDDAVVTPADVPATLVSNERVRLAAYHLAGLDSERYNLCVRADAYTTETTLSHDEVYQGFIGNLVFKGQRRAIRMADMLPEWAATARGTGRAIYDKAATWFESRTSLALAFWNGAYQEWMGQHEARGQSGRGPVDERQRAQRLRSLEANPVAATSAERVSRATRRFLERDSVAVPRSAVYGANARTLFDEISREIRRLAENLGDFKLTGDPSRYQIIPWLVLRLEILRQVAKAYNPAKDTDTFDDTRQGHRLRVATEARRLAVDLDDMDLEEACLAIFTNEAAGMSRLVLISDWRKPARSNLDDFHDDFPRGIKLGPNLIVDSSAVVNFYRARFLRKIADVLDRDLEPAYAILNKDTLLVKKALTAAGRDVPMPSRWQVDDYDWAPNPDETNTIAAIVQHHAKSEAQLPKSSNATAVVYPGQEVIGSTAAARNLPGVFAWELPDWGAVLTAAAHALARLDEFAQLGAVGEDPIGWMAAAEDLIGQDELLGRLFTSTLTTAFRADAAVEEERLGVDLPQHERDRRGIDRLRPGLLREATSHDRRVVASQVELLLDAFVKGDDIAVNHGETLVAWELPNEALDRMHRFTRYALPASDNIAQTAALVIELAPALQAAFVQEGLFGFEIAEDRYDIITGYFGLLLLAERWMEDASHRRRLREEFLDLDETELETRRKAAAKVLASFRAVRAKVQRGRGFESTAGGLRSLNYVSTIKPGDRFGYENATVELVRILLPEGRQFRFHPEYGFGDSHSPAQVVDATSGEALPPDTELIEVILNDETPIAVRARDVVLLDHIWRAVEERAFQLAMENVEAAMLEAVSLALDVAEFIPGAGQALMVGRIVAAVAMFLASADFEDIKEALTGELLDQVSRLKDEVVAGLAPDQVWMYLLFDADTSFVDKLKSYDSTSARHRRLRRRKGKIGRLLRIARSIGSQFAWQFEAMRDRIQPPLRSTQSFVLTHPLLTQGFALAADVIRFPPPEIPTLDDIADLAGSVNRRFDEILEAIEGFELPDEIVPLDLAIDAVLGILLDRLGAKGKIANDILRATGAREEVARMIADALELAELNPNDAWSGKGRFEGKGVRSHVDGLVNDARKEFLDGVNGALRAIGFTSLGAPEHKEISSTTIDHPASGGDAAPSLAPGVEEADVLPGLPTSGDIIPAGPGDPLPTAARADAERHYHAGFGHVRLHRAEVARGVDAVARGSHVVVRPGLSLTDGRGRDVLRHELAHVAEAPTVGRGSPGTGLRFDPAAEQRADAAAATGRLAPRPRGRGDASPALGQEVLAKVLDRLASFEDLRTYQTDVDAGDGDLPEGNQVQQRAMERLREDVIAALTSSTVPVTGVPSRIGVGPRGQRWGAVDGEGLVRKHARDNVAPRVSNLSSAEGEGFDRIVRRALVEVTKPTKGKKARRGPRVYELDPKRFAALVEGYLLVRGGLQTNVDLDLKVAGDPELFLRKATAGEGFTLKITGIFLGAVTRASGLWTPILEDQLAIGRTLTGTSDDTGTAGEPGYAPVSFVIGDEADQTRLFHALVRVIRKEGPRANVLEHGYRIRESLVERAVDAASLTSTIDPGDLPRPAEYLATTPRGGRNIGLRVATHGELKKLMSTTVERHSHHTTQFLFAEYLSMESEPKPFLPREPGLELETSKPKRLHRADRKAAIEIAELRGGSERGGPMPAILIAGRTHERANLHVGHSPPRDATDVTSRSSQAYTVDGWFRDGRGKPPAVAVGEMPVAPDQVGGLPADSPARRRNEAVVKGVENVYVHMRRTMLKALHAGLLKEEALYYETIAARRTDALDKDKNLKDEWRLDAKQLERVYDVAAANNDKIMTDHGVRVP